MPYRRAHLWLLLLLATIPIAFWPNYFAPGAQRTGAMHGHAAAASAWLALLTVQGWSASRRRFALHRASGRAVFVAVPAFAAAGAAVIVDMARRFVAASDPFHAVTGARLAMCDALALAAFVALVVHAVATRRRVRRHAAAMLATALLVLPPLTGRLLQHMPGYPGTGAFGLSAFELSFQIGQWGSAALCWYLYRRDPREAAPFLFAALACVAQSLLYHTLAATAAWETAVRTIAGTPMIPAALAGAALAGLALWTAWLRPARSRPRVSMA